MIIKDMKQKFYFFASSSIDALCITNAIKYKYCHNSFEAHDLYFLLILRLSRAEMRDEPRLAGTILGRDGTKSRVVYCVEYSQ